jgi:nucleoside-diphosphate-sugar epimerase
VNIATLAHEVAAALPPEVDVNIASAPAPGVPPHRYVPSTARASEELGLRAEVPLREAICRTHAWFSGNTLSGQENENSTPAAIARGAHA